jgi:glyoxylase-like metal-dependent hydrolase (beta-lactamase superfamily II)
VGNPTVDEVYEQVRKAVPAQAHDAVPTVTPVAPGIRVLALRTPTLPPATQTNVYLVGPLVVDPGSPHGDQQAILEDALSRERVAAIVLTHHHGDHVGGAQALADRLGVPIAAHAATARRLAGKVTVTRELSDNEVFEGVTCVLTEGHAEGHLCFELGDATIAGDMVAGVGTILIDPSEGDMAVYLASLQRLLERGTNTLLPAHGPVIANGPEKLREYIAHRMMREAKVVAALAARTDASPAELVADVYSDTPRILWPLAERSLRAHLDKLVREHRAREPVPGRWTSHRGPL